MTMAKGRYLRMRACSAHRKEHAELVRPVTAHSAAGAYVITPLMQTQQHRQMSFTAYSPNTHSVRPSCAYCAHSEQRYRRNGRVWVLLRTCLARSRARLAYCLDSAVSWLDIWLMPADVHSSA